VPQLEAATKVKPGAASGGSVDDLLPEPRAARAGTGMQSVFDLLPGTDPVSAAMKKMALRFELAPIDLRLFLFSGGGGATYDPERSDVTLDARNAICTADAAEAVEHGALATLLVSFVYRYILRESCSQFDSLPLTSLTKVRSQRSSYRASESRTRRGLRRCRRRRRASTGVQQPAERRFRTQRRRRRSSSSRFQAWRWTPRSRASR
jgi:hypothetical protein